MLKKHVLKLNVKRLKKRQVAEKRPAKKQLVKNQQNAKLPKVEELSVGSSKLNGMKTYKKKQDQTKSKKAHKPDPAKNDQFHEHDTPDEKRKNHKVPHGKFYGKRWFPQ